MLKSSGKYKIRNLEFNLSHACNLKCKGCDHLSPYFSLKDYDSEGKISLERFKEWFTILGKYMEMENFLLVGGEPLLNKELIDYLSFIKKSTLVEKVVLVTNGFLLQRQDQRLFQYLDEISMSSYPSHPLPEKYIDTVQKLCKKNHTKLYINRQNNFYTNLVAEKILNDSMVNKIFQTCSLAWKQKCYTLFDGFLVRCSRVPFIDYKLRQLGITEEELIKEDGLRIENKDGFQDDLEKYFTSSVPLASCHYCLGSVGRKIKHAQLSVDEIKNEVWMLESNRKINRIKIYRRLLKKKLFGHI